MDLQGQAGGNDGRNGLGVRSEVDFFWRVCGHYVARGRFPTCAIRCQFYRVLYRTLFNGGAVPEAPVFAERGGTGQKPVKKAVKRCTEMAWPVGPTLRGLQIIA